jgi:thiol-disulfide isomerase/thioredoxin
VLNDWALVLMLAVSLSGNAFLGYRLSAANKGLPSTQSTIRGSTVTSIEGTGEDGARRIVSLVGEPRPAVIFVYSPTCVWCRQTWPMFRQLAMQARGRYRFVTLSVGDGPVFSDASVLALSKPSGPNVRALLSGSVPLTVVVSTDGKVVESWVGGYAGPVGVLIGRYFGIPITKSSTADIR